MERILSTHATLRQQRRNVLDFVHEACSAALDGTQAPSLIAVVRKVDTARVKLRRVVASRSSSRPAPAPHITDSNVGGGVSGGAPSLPLTVNGYRSLHVDSSGGIHSGVACGPIGDRAIVPASAGSPEPAPRTADNRCFSAPRLRWPLHHARGRPAGVPTRLREYGGSGWTHERSWSGALALSVTSLTCAGEGPGGRGDAFCPPRRQPGRRPERSPSHRGRQLRSRGSGPPVGPVPARGRCAAER